MKKVLLAAAVAIFGAMNAQTEKGNWVVAGNTSLSVSNAKHTVKYGSNSETAPGVTTVVLSPSIGYFVMDNLSVNLDLALLSASQKEGDYKESSSTFSVMPGATYYFRNSSQLIPFLGANVGYASMVEKETYKGSTDKTNIDGFSWKVKGGVAYMMTDALALNIGLDYGQFRHSEDLNNVKVKQIIGTFAGTVGLSYFFRTGHKK